jgi:hypothetical protein
MLAGWPVAGRAGVPTDFAAKLKALERENRELRQANEHPIGRTTACATCFPQRRPERQIERMIQRLFTKAIT